MNKDKLTNMHKKKKLNSDNLLIIYRLSLVKDFDLLMKYINEYGLDAVDKDGNNILLYCATDKMFTILISKMIEQIDDLNVNFQNKTGNSALHIAVKTKNMDLLELLLKNKNINVNIQDCNGNTPLAKALFLFDERIDEDIIIKLLESGADINELDNFGYRLHEYLKSMKKVNEYIKKHKIKIIRRENYEKNYSMVK